jgi:hypothetical protein
VANFAAAAFEMIADFGFVLPKISNLQLQIVYQ